jgi:hypothetical protein
MNLDRHVPRLLAISDPPPLSDFYTIFKSFLKFFFMAFATERESVTYL